MNFDELNGKNRSLFGYFIAALSGAVLGGILLLMFAPGALLSKFSQPHATTAKLQLSTVSVEQQGTNTVTTPQGIVDIGMGTGKGYAVNY